MIHRFRLIWLQEVSPDSAWNILLATKKLTPASGKEIVSIATRVQGIQLIKLSPP